MIVSNPTTIDLADVQGMITRGYSKLYQTAYFLLKVEDAANAKKWIGESIPKIDTADILEKCEQTLHLAFTYNGLDALGLHKENLGSFPVPFRDGMVTTDRSRILGDYGESSPKNWTWGSKESGVYDIHLLLILHAKEEDEMESFFKEEEQRLNDSKGFEIVRTMRGHNRKDFKEPFGFHDGISQPVIKGTGRPGPDKDLVATGEFLMGHKNEHNQYPASPTLTVRQGEVGMLPDVPNAGKNTPILVAKSKKDPSVSGTKSDDDILNSETKPKHDMLAKTPAKDLGKNGSFMVFRQMEQHVEEFWDAMHEKTKTPEGALDEKAAIKLASQCVGRWPSGAALVNFPDEDPGGAPTNDDFGYADLDPDGMRCPFGSHLRRNNPRDAFRWYNKKQSLKVTNRHRIVRRGRIYEDKKQKETGLLFICFNANIELQFEFIQHAWANNNQLRHLKDDVDIIIGAPLEDDPNNGKYGITVQGEPTNTFYEGWKRFVTIKGGQYFFMPSMTFLNFIRTI